MCFLQHFWYIMGYEVCFCGLVWKHKLLALALWKSFLFFDVENILSFNHQFKVLKIEDFKGWVGEASSLSGSC